MDSLQDAMNFCDEEVGKLTSAQPKKDGGLGEENDDSISDEEICQVVSPDHPNAENTFTEIVQRKPELIMTLFDESHSGEANFPLMKDQPYSKKLLATGIIEWVKNDPVAFMRVSQRKMGRFDTFNPEIMEEVLGQERMDSFKHQALIEAVKVDPVYFMERLLDAPDVERIFGKEGRNQLARRAIEGSLESNIIAFQSRIVNLPITKTLVSH